jgi:hypothetical protein
LVKQFFLGPCFDESVSSLKRGRLQNPEQTEDAISASCVKPTDSCAGKEDLFHAVDR